MPSNHDLKTIFREEIAARGGTVTDALEHGPRLYLRSVLSLVADARPKDPTNGGVALLANDEEIRVHPYTFRQVCRNGAIWAHALQTLRIERAAPAECAGWTLERVRHGIRECSSPVAFEHAMEQTRSATVESADLALTSLASLASHAGLPHRIYLLVLDRYLSDSDRSAYGLMNAVTAVARGTRDPDERWRMEELGGGICAALREKPRAPRSRAKRSEPATA